MTDPTQDAAPTSRRDLRNFGFTFASVSAIFFGILTWKGRPSALYFALVAAGFALAGAVAPGLLRPFHGPWMKFAELLGVVNTRVLLAIFFFVGLTPISALMRMIGKDPMNRRFKGKGATSYWIAPPVHPDGVRHFDRQF